MKTTLLLTAFLIALCLALDPAGAAALTITFNDGHTATAPSVRLQGRTLMAAVENGTGEIGYPLDGIAWVDSPEPPQLQTAVDLLASNKPAEALVRIAPALAEAAAVKDVPGNRWARLALLQADTLFAVGREAESLPVLDALAGSQLDPETILSVQVRQAAALARKGDGAKALSAYDSIIGRSRDPSVLARAWLGKGQILLAQRKWEPAVFASLRLPVFYPGQKTLVPAALLVAGKALAEIGDKAAADQQLQEILSGFPGSPEAAQARAEIEKSHTTQNQ